MFADTDYSKILAAAVAALLVTGIGSVATAQSAGAQGSASITILESLQVTQQQAVNFGAVHRPSQGQNTLVLDYEDDSVTTRGGGDAQFVEGSSSSGLFTIQGGAGESIQMSVAAGNFDDPGISLDEAFIDGFDDEAAGTLDDTGNHDAGVGGAVTIGDDASLGTHTADVQVTVEYE